jgi:hypothetical protein
MADELRINGNLVGWPSVIFKIDGERWTGITSLGWDQARERAYGTGMGRSGAPLAQTPGKYTPGPLKVRLFEHTAIALRKFLAAKSVDGKSYGSVKVPMTLQVAEGAITSTVNFNDCSVSKETPNVEESAEGMVEEWEFSNMGIVTDGLTLFDSFKS